MVSHLDEAALLEARVEREHLLPIAASRGDLDLFRLTTPSAPISGEVLWFAGGLIDQFPDFEAYFLAMQDYNRLQVQKLRRVDG